MRGWNSHPLRSERNWTPEQLWANGMMDLRNSYVTHVAEVQESINSETLEHLEWFEMDWYAPTPSDEGLSTIEVLDVDVPFNDDVSESDSKCKSIAIFTVIWNRYFYRRYESCFKLVGLKVH